VKKILDFSGLTVLVIDDDEEGGAFLDRNPACVRRDGGRQHPSSKACVRQHAQTRPCHDRSCASGRGRRDLKWLRQQPSEGGGTVPVTAVTARYENYPPTEVSG